MKEYSDKPLFVRKSKEQTDAIMTDDLTVLKAKEKDEEQILEESKAEIVERLSHAMDDEVVLEDFGLCSDDINNRELTANEVSSKNDKDREALIPLIENKTILMGQISAIEEANSTRYFIINVQFNGVRIIIPDYEYFEDEYSFGDDYSELKSDDMKTSRRRAHALYHVGALIYFVVKSYGLDSEKRIVGVASRREAMAMLRDEWFLHSDPDKLYEHSVEVGNIAKAHVISVSPKYATVECLGVETRLDAYSLCEEYIENCNDYVSPGDTINVRIKKLHTDEGTYLTVSGRLNDNSSTIHSMKIYSTYLGTVEHYNKEKKFYYVRLKNGVPVIVYSSSITGSEVLFAGQNVAVYIYALMDEYAVGSVSII